MNRRQIAPVVELALNVYNFTQLIEQFVDERVEEVEDFVDALREDSEPLDAIILFVEMILDGYEVYRSMTQVYYFITQFFQALVNSYTAINSFLEAVNLPSLDLGL